MLTTPSQRAGRRGLSSPINPSSLKAPRAISTVLQIQLLPHSPGVTLFSFSIPTGPAAPSPHHLLLATVAASELAAAWCFISPSPWQLAYSLTQRPLSCLGHKSTTHLRPRSETGVTAHPACCWEPCCHCPSLPAGAVPSRHAVCPPWYHVCTPQAKSNSHPKKQYQKAGGFPSLQANGSHPYKPAMSWCSSSFGQGAESWASPQ